MRKATWRAGLTLVQHLNLYDCQEQDVGSAQQFNTDLWHIPDFVAPRPGGVFGQDMVIEVDPEYM